VVKLSLANNGQQPHDFQLLTVDGTHTKEEILENVSSDGAPIPPWLHSAGGVGTVGPGAPPGVAYVKLAPNMACWYVCNETIDDNKPHTSLGMIASPDASTTSSSAPSGPPPIDFEKAVSVGALDPGQSEVAGVRFATGSYVFLCFIEDRAGGPPHFTKGMITEYKVS